MPPPSPSPIADAPAAPIAWLPVIWQPVMVRVPPELWMAPALGAARGALEGHVLGEGVA